MPGHEASFRSVMTVFLLATGLLLVVFLSVQSVTFLLLLQMSVNDVVIECCDTQVVVAANVTL